MKRRSRSSDAVVVATGEEGSICPPYLDREKLLGELGSGDGGFTSMEEDDDCGDEELCSGRGAGACRRASGSTAGGGSEKKRRLSSEQVRALQRSFEVENKLEAERKVRLAMELGLQPRQVAVWFQNRRARWKTKQLERDYLQLKSSHDALQADHRALLAEVTELRGKVADRTAAPRPCTSCSTASLISVKEEPALSDSGKKIACSEPGEEEVAEPEVDEEVPLPPPDADPAALVYKDGTSYTDSSDSSAVLNVCEDDTTGLFSPIHHQQQFPGPPSCHYSHKQIEQHQLPPSFPSAPPLAARMVEKHFLTVDDCGSSFFADEQFSFLPWSCSDQWS